MLAEIHSGKRITSISYRKQCCSRSNLKETLQCGRLNFPSKVIPNPSNTILLQCLKADSLSDYCFKNSKLDWLSLFKATDILMVDLTSLLLHTSFLK